MKRRATLAALLIGAGLSGACAPPEPAPDAASMARQHGVDGAVARTVATEVGELEGTLVPVTMADGRRAHLFVPTYQSRDVAAVYLRDEQGLHAVPLTGHITRDVYDLTTRHPE